MSDEMELGRLLETWFDDGPAVMPDRVRSSVRGRISQQAQRRTLGRNRSPKMSLFLKLAAVAMIAVALIGGAILLAGGRNHESPPVNPLPSILSTDVPIGTNGPVVSASASSTAAGESLRARWIANDPGSSVLGTSSGPIDLTVDGSGSSVAVGNLGNAGNFGSSIVGATGDQLIVRLDHATRDCAAGAEGTYTWALGSDGSQLTLTALSDACSDRTIAFGRAWARTLIGSSATGTGIVDSFAPAFFIALPGGPYTSRVLPDYVDVGQPNGLDFQVWKDPQGFADPCSLAQRAPYSPGAAAVVDYLRHSPAIKVIQQTSLRIDGHPAIHIVVDGRTVAKCPGGDVQLWTPKACQCHWTTADGVRDSFYLVDVGSDTFAFELNPVGLPNESAIIDRLRIPAALPGS
jgi:hypothetical protein